MSGGAGGAAGPIVVKIGGSTLGSGDTALEDVVALRARGERVIVVHGGGALISEWLDRLGAPSEFVEGLRATSAEALEVVIAVLRGVVNARLVAALARLGGRAAGVSGLDGGLLRAERRDPRLGFVGEVTGVDCGVLEALLADGATPVVAPIGLEPPGQPLNVNADTAAGEIARAAGASRLVFLTDVDGVLDGAGRPVGELDAARAAALRRDGTLSGGMIPKIAAALRAAERGADACVTDGRLPHALERAASGGAAGTRIAVARTGG